jgi:hypothetical protein
MGEAKRKKESGELSPADRPILPGLPITAGQSAQFVKITTKASWVGITILIIGWVVFRWLGPALGWWHLAG